MAHTSKQRTVTSVGQHELGFDVLSTQGKSMYIDGHKREDVVEYRKGFVGRMAEIGFLNKGNAPTPEAANYITYSSHTEQQKNIVIFHDESIFTVNDDQKTQWGTKDMLVIKPKGKGSGIMVSDFVDEHNGYLCFVDCDGRKHEARVLMEYGANKEGYWTIDKFLQQMEKAVKIADLKYPKSEGYKITWIFDNSSCHNAYSQDALVAMHMNAKCGGKQPCMRDTMWKGKIQTLVNNKGIPKGLIQVLKERGKYREKMKLAEMREEIATHQDFQDEKPIQMIRKLN